MRWAMAVVLLTAQVTWAQQGDIEGFTQAVTAYALMHRESAADLPVGSDPAAAVGVAITLAERIRSRRPNAQSGEVFGPAATTLRAEIRRELAGPQGNAILAAINESNVDGARIRVNRRYPPGLPRPTMPGQLLTKLPPLPAELEYRFLGRSLLLIDTRAQLIVDVLPDVLPPRQLASTPAR